MVYSACLHHFLRKVAPRCGLPLSQARVLSLDFCAEKGLVWGWFESAGSQGLSPSMVTVVTSLLVPRLLIGKQYR